MIIKKIDLSRNIIHDLSNNNFFNIIYNKTKTIYY